MDASKIQFFVSQAIVPERWVEDILTADELIAIEQIRNYLNAPENGQIMDRIVEILEDLC